MPHKILVIGELNVDILLNHIQGFPLLGKEILAEQMQTVLGSSSAIFAANIASLGANVSFCGAVGDDQNGSFIIRELEERNIDVALVKKFKNTGTGATIILNYGQDRANVTYGGAMDLLTTHDIPWGDLDRFDHVHISNFFIQKGLRKDIVSIFRDLKSAGLSTSLDPQWDVLEKWDFDYKTCLPYIDIFLPNEAELKALTGKSELEEAISVASPFSRLLALKMGTRGSIAVESGKRFEVPAYHVDEFTDAIGAGDSFNAGFILKHLDGADTIACLENGNLMGAINTTRAGGTAAFKNLDELHKSIQSLKAQNISIS